MPSPFPGMDPYLENPIIWPDFHHHLATFITVELNATLPPPYYARVELRPELGIVLGDRGNQRIIPDVLVMQQPGPALQPTSVALGVARTTITEPVRITTHTEPFKHPFVEIRDAQSGHELITLLEILSPSNKEPGPDRRAYERKQREILNSDVHLIEIDLLRQGDPVLPHPELAAAVELLNTAYLILINRANGDEGTRNEYEVYPVHLQDILPCIPVPLRPEASDVALDLQVVFNRTYDGGMYRRSLNYNAAPEPPLTEAEAAWADELLRQAGFRTA